MSVMTDNSLLGDEPFEDSDAENNQGGNEHGFNVTLINTNVRSLCPKINSLVECMKEVDAAFGVLTETWL